MTIRDDDRARTPGPLGGVPSGFGGRRPGPLGIGPGSLVVATPLATAASKTLKMPKPAAEGKTKLVRAVSWPLGKGKPEMGDIQQQVLYNCAIASILGALANTEVGRKRIGALVDEGPGTVVTDLSDVRKELSPEYKGGDTITSNRSFTVKLARGSVEVSDVFYTDEGDQDSWSMIYMHSPNKKLWPCAIEKGFVALLGNDYGVFQFGSAQRKIIPAEEIWKDLVGKDPDILEIKADTPLSTITAAAKAAPQTPTIGASRDVTTYKNLWSYHGFTMLGLSGPNILLFDADEKDPDQKRITISPSDFRDNFKAILSGKP